jgi:Flp pilus assembly protein TadD
MRSRRRKAKVRGVVYAGLLAVLCLLPAAGMAEEDTTEAEIQFSRGLFALNADDLNEAIKRFEAAHEAAPGEARFLFYLGLAENRSQKYRRALEHLQRANDMDPGLTGLPYEMGVAHMGQGEWEEAKTWLEEARRRQPRRGAVYMQLGVVEDRLGNTSDALTLFDKALALDPGLQDHIAFHRGRTYLQEGMVDRARSELSLAARSENDRITSISGDFLGRIDVARAGPPDRWDFTGWFGTVYDTNVVLSPNDPGIFFPITDQEDFRATLFAHVKFRPWVGRKGSMGLGLGGYQSWHETLSEFDLTGITPEVDFLWWGEPFTMRALLLGGRYNLDREQYLDFWSVEVRPGVRQRNYGNTEFLFRYSDDDYEFNPRDATAWTVGVDQYFYPWQNKGRYVHATASYSDRDSTSDFARWEKRFVLDFFTPLGEDWDFYAGFFYTHFDYKEDHSFFGVPRNDRQYIGMMRARYDLKKYLALVLEWRGTNQQSNIDFFSYDRQVFTIGISARP